MLNKTLCHLAGLLLLSVALCLGAQLSWADPASSAPEQSKPALPPMPAFKIKPDIDRSPSSVFYEPVIELGMPHTKTTVWFYWSAVSSDSLSEFRKRIMTAVNAHPRRAIKFVLYQIFDKQSHDMIGPGAYLICPDKYNDYVKLALRYLSKATNVTKLAHADDPGLYYNAYIKSADHGRLWQSKSCQQSNFLTRQLLEVRKSQDFYAVAGDRALPVYVIDGIPYSKDDRKLNVVFGKTDPE